MALKIVTGGTTGAADGTLVSSGNPLVIVALNTAVDAHIRCDDGYWSNDQAFDVPAQLEVSFDGGSTWYDNADEPFTAPEIYAVNVPIKIRQTVAAGSSSGSFTTDGTYTAIAALSTPTLTATVISDTQIDLSWTNVSNEDASPGYTIERSPDGSSWSALTTKAQNVTTHSDTGLTPGTIYYYRVKAEGSGRYSDSSYGTDDDTTTNSNLSDTFSSSLNTTTWLAVTSGSGTVATSGGKAVVTKPANGDKAFMVAKILPIAAGTTKTIKAKVDLSDKGASDWQHGVLVLARKTSAPASGDTWDVVTAYPLVIELYAHSNGSVYYRFRYVNTGGTSYWYDFGSAAWSTTFDSATDGTGSWKVLPSGATAQYTYLIEVHATNGFRMVVKSADEATTHDTSAYVAAASLYGSGDYYPGFGGYQYAFTTAFSGVINVDSIAVS